MFLKLIVLFYFVDRIQMVGESFLSVELLYMYCGIQIYRVVLWLQSIVRFGKVIKLKNVFRFNIFVFFVILAYVQLQGFFGKNKFLCWSQLGKVSVFLVSGVGGFIRFIYYWQYCLFRVVLQNFYLWRSRKKFKQFSWIFRFCVEFVIFLIFQLRKLDAVVIERE